jgi:hypothetical protein
MTERDPEITEATAIPIDELTKLVNKRLRSDGPRAGESRKQTLLRISHDVMSERYDAEVRRRAGLQ